MGIVAPTSIPVRQFSAVPCVQHVVHHYLWRLILFDLDIRCRLSKDKPYCSLEMVHSEIEEVEKKNKYAIDFSNHSFFPCGVLEDNHSGIP
ncbi:hypothetical protein AVEN_181352-1 [Araneus ventricosus]|uniref:Uncharacterized protein n=1 Tax=Araneus ventricosus TaxID=182803 RepID=A0A4Y1ZLX6_ARAVE|nr:hypothetical protein AVEN_181352-1 [Araneus ventricosus]